MAYRIFSYPATLSAGDDAAELNAFLHGHKIVSVHKEFLNDGADSRWCFCVEYLDGTPPAPPPGGAGFSKVDYREVLDEKQFARFRLLREARKKLAEEDGVPVYAVFSNEQLADMARSDGNLDIAAMKKIPGIGEKKAARYGERFLSLVAVDAPGGADEQGGASPPGEPSRLGGDASPHPEEF